MQCQRIFQANAPINCICLHPNQAALVIGDQSGCLHVWDLVRDTSTNVVCECLLLFSKCDECFISCYSYKDFLQVRIFLSTVVPPLNQSNDCSIRLFSLRCAFY